MAGLLASGCTTTYSFVDPKVPPVSYDALASRGRPLRLLVSVDFQQNGSSSLRDYDRLRLPVQRTLDRSGLVSADPDGPDGEIKIVVNELVDSSKFRAAVTRSGIRFGSGGSIVVSGYVMSVDIRVNGKVRSVTGITHSIFTGIGDAGPLPGAEIVPASVAFDRIVESMLLRALSGLQTKQVL